MEFRYDGCCVQNRAVEVVNQYSSLRAQRGEADFHVVEIVPAPCLIYDRSTWKGWDLLNFSREGRVSRSFWLGNHYMGRKARCSIGF